MTTCTCIDAVTKRATNTLLSLPEKLAVSNEPID
jgi:hypothetical protein